MIKPATENALANLCLFDNINDIDLNFPGQLEQFVLLDSLKKVRSSVRLRLVLIHSYGLFHQQPKSLKEIGEMLGVTRERISHIRQAALRYLRHPLRAQHVAMLYPCKRKNQIIEGL